MKRNICYVYLQITSKGGFLVSDFSPFSPNPGENGIGRKWEKLYPVYFNDPMSNVSPLAVTPRQLGTLTDSDPSLPSPSPLPRAVGPIVDAPSCASHTQIWQDRGANPGPQWALGNCIKWKSDTLAVPHRNVHITSKLQHKRV